jgi:multicomponent Na+:H+ antiporter subunit A
MLGPGPRRRPALLYVFWELTSVTSVPAHRLRRREDESRRGAQQALLVTDARRAGDARRLILLGQEAGTYSISALLADPPRGGTVAVALVLVLVGAFTKSAQVPFHPWLPSAMAAPTPVSAYLHAAAMVKAGVYLVALLAPGVRRGRAVAARWCSRSAWPRWSSAAGARCGRATSSALLAFGTVSQLGFLFVLVGAGTREAALAGATLLLAHGLFKSALFLTVGVIDHETGTRDLRQLSGSAAAARCSPIVATLAALSMAGVPPLLGFVSKEAAYEAFLDGGAGDLLVLAGLFVGSVLTAPTARASSGARSRPSRAARSPTPSGPSPWFLAPVVRARPCGLLLGLLPFVADPLVQAYAAAYGGPEPTTCALARAHPGAAAVGVTVAAGAALFALRDPVRHAQHRLHRVLGASTPTRPTRARSSGVDRAALRSTSLVQTGSLPVYLGMVL